MKMTWGLALGLLVLPMTGCASMQVDRDLKHAELSQQYRGAIAQVTAPNPTEPCISPNVGTAWTTFGFAPSTPIAKLPSGMNAAAICVRIIRAFVDEISVPVTKDGGEHIDYVPTQVICEYLAQIFEPAPGARLGGLIYPSAVQVGGKNLVVFPEDRYLGSYHGVTFVGAGK